MERLERSVRLQETGERGRLMLASRHIGKCMRPRDSKPANHRKDQKTFSSTPKVKARATSTGAGAVLRTMEHPTATSALAMTGKLGRLRRRAWYG